MERQTALSDSLEISQHLHLPPYSSSGLFPPLSFLSQVSDLVPPCCGRCRVPVASVTVISCTLRPSCNDRSFPSYHALLSHSFPYSSYPPCTHSTGSPTDRRSFPSIPVGGKDLLPRLIYQSSPPCCFPHYRHPAARWTRHLLTHKGGAPEKV